MLNAARPTRQELLAARSRGVPDVIAAGLRVLFVGINPGLYSAAIGHHFGRPGNRFWPALHRAGFTDRLLSPHEDGELLQQGYGITNLVARTTATADELSTAELIEGGRGLQEKVRRYAPATVAVLGVGAYRQALGYPRAQVGLQQETLASATVWVLPNPSGLNAHYQLEDLVREFRALYEAIEHLAVSRGTAP